MPEFSKSLTADEAVAKENPLATYSSVNSSASDELCSRLMCDLVRPRKARSLSRWLLTETNSPAAIDNAPETSPANPASRIVSLDAEAPVTPSTSPAVETIPSFAPRTAARSLFSWLFEVAM